MTEAASFEAPHVPADSLAAAIGRHALRVLPSLGVKPGWLYELPPVEDQPSERPVTEIEVVSHCWNYAHLLQYQLSSLVLAPPQTVDVRMTVCFCPADQRTAELLAFFSAQTVPRVSWNWIPLAREALLRRVVGRNVAAKRSRADWVWFTDCDVVFADCCFDTMASRLAGRADRLIYPQEERTTRMLAADDPVLTVSRENLAVRGVDFERFMVQRPRQATGPLQITRGDVARRWGYCDRVSCYQRTTDRWRKTYEDRVFRWLLGTPGVPLDLPGIYRIKHVEKGRYQKGWWSRLRSQIRRHKEAADEEASP